jgi:hypothetical protein
MMLWEWYNWFKDGCTSVDSEPCSSWPSTSQTDQVIGKVDTVVTQNHHVTIQEIAEEVDINSSLAHSRLTEDLAMTTMLQHIPRT